MKLAFKMIFLVVTLVLAGNIIITRSVNKKIAKYSRRIMYAGTIATLSQLILISSSSEKTASLMLGVFFACMDFILYFILDYCMVYTEHEHRSDSKHFFMLALVVADSLFMITNYFHHLVFDLQEIEFQGELYFKALKYLPYYTHLVFCYIIAIHCVLTLVLRMRQLPKFYWPKYYFFFIGFTIVVLWDAIYVFKPNPIDTSIIGYGICAMILNYYALFYEPKYIIENMLKRAISDMNNMVFLFDIEDNCIFINEEAQTFFGIKDKNQDLKEVLAIFMDPVKEDWKDANYNYSCSATLNRNNKKYYLEIHYARLLEDDRLVGYFFDIMDITEQHKRLEQERFLAEHDTLTGVYNKEKLYKVIDEVLDRDNDNCSSYYLISCDFKDFKLINDIYGEAAGDGLLKKLADTLVKMASPGTKYGRIGNDKFGMLLEKKNYNRDIFEYGPREIMRLDENFLYPVVIHVGIYDLANGRLPVGIMFDRTTLAISSIKDNFEKRIAFYDANMRNQKIWDQKIASNLNLGIKERQIVPYLQPQIDLSGNVEGAEVLVRWNHPEEGFLTPNKFIPTFETNGMILELDRYMWRQACELLRKWSDGPNKNAYLSVNISPRDFYYVDLYKEFTSLIKEFGIDPQLLRLEITETVFMNDIENKVLLLKRLREEGFIIEMDDFGSGYSSLNLLKNLPIDVLKIDMMFLGKNNDSIKANKILAGTIRMAKDIGLTVISEGVENKEEAEFLKKCGCDYMQGYYYAKPMSVESFEANYLK
jgi:EAL domain-containing protein (putative c-di-GMP-specific phosphodiesterase class I)/PAS domain-containing protein